MAYFAPFIDESGFHIPTYSDIRDYLVLQAKTIFGSDIYLEPDSQDYQWISSVSDIVYDSFLTAQKAFNGRSPVTAIGVGLDAIVKLNGIRRNAGETDSQLRARQATSVSIATQTILEGLKGGIASVDGVTRYKVYENDTDATVGTLPAHSITCVVEGGTDNDVALAIHLKKGIGCYTNGTTEIEVTDSFFNVATIRFYRPSYIDIDVVVNVKALSGYTTETTADIKQHVSDYLNSLNIGDDALISSLWGASLGAMLNLSSPSFSITGLTAALHEGVQATTDIEIAFNEVSRGVVANVSVVVT